MTGRGRLAALPVTGYRPPQRLFLDGTTCTVRFYPEDGGSFIDFDFASLPVARGLQVAMACAFDRLTGPAGSRRASKSAEILFQFLRSFARSCAGSPRPPTSAQDISVVLLKEHALRRKILRSWSHEHGDLRMALLAMEGLPPEVRAFLQRPLTPRQDANLASYSKAEQRTILRAARATVRAAADRIRRNTALLQRWRDGAIDKATDRMAWEYGWLLDHLATAGDVPRYATPPGAAVGMVYRHGTRDELMCALNLSWREAAAACVLLISATGMNGGTLLTAPAAHHRPDAHAGGIAVALVDVVKPRRGRRERYMTLPLADLPDWVGRHEPGDVLISAGDELRTPFGLYTLILELTSVARAISGSKRLFLWCGNKKGHRAVPLRTPIREGLPHMAVPDWGRDCDLRGDATDAAGEPLPLHVTMTRLRLTFVTTFQRPVAHSHRTLANSYLARDRGREAIVELQRVVAGALAEQVKKVREAPRPVILSPADLAEAATNPRAVAGRCGVTVEVLRRILAGDLTTVLASCADHNHGPFTPAGEPCTASFLLCLGCPCARVTPQHLPVLLLVRDELEQRRLAMVPLQWVQRFGVVHAQLDDVIGRFGGATIRAARSDIAEEDRLLVRRVLDRELDSL